MSEEAGTRIEIPVDEDRARRVDDVPVFLVGRAWQGSDAARRSVAILGALGAEQRYLRHLAPWLASRGWGVLTCDYRGMGESPPTGPRTNLDAWGRDAEAILRAARARFGCAKLIAFGHSLGGMLFGHSGAGPLADGALALASGLGAPRFYGIGRDRVRLELAYFVLPRLARLRGHLPAFALGARVPLDVMLQWERWGRAGRYLRWDGSPSTEAFARYRGKLVGVGLTDDGYAPRRALDAFLGSFPRANVRREVLAPRQGEELGHFGLFRPDAPEWAREALLRELEGLAE